MTVRLYDKLQMVTRRRGAVAKVARVVDAGPRPAWAVSTGGNVAEDRERCYGRRAGLPARAIADLPVARADETGARNWSREDRAADHGRADSAVPP